MTRWLDGAACTYCRGFPSSRPLLLNVSKTTVPCATADVAVCCRFAPRRRALYLRSRCLRYPSGGELTTIPSALKGELPELSKLFEVLETSQTIAFLANACGQKCSDVLRPLVETGL